MVLAQLWLRSVKLPTSTVIQRKAHISTQIFAMKLGLIKIIINTNIKFKNWTYNKCEIEGNVNTK